MCIVHFQTHIVYKKKVPLTLIAYIESEFVRKTKMILEKIIKKNVIEDIEGEKERHRKKNDVILLSHCMIF